MGEAWRVVVAHNVAKDYTDTAGDSKDCTEATSATNYVELVDTTYDKAACIVKC